MLKIPEYVMSELSDACDSAAENEDWSDEEKRALLGGYSALRAGLNLSADERKAVIDEIMNRADWDGNNRGRTRRYFDEALHALGALDEYDPTAMRLGSKPRVVKIDGKLYEGV